MNVLFLRPQPGIRSLKYALAFKSVGFDIEIIHGYTSKTLTEFYGYGDEHFENFVKLDLGNLERDIRRLVNKYQIDLIHSQNAPDYLTVSAIRAVDAPVIHENQDVISMRKTPFSPGAYPGADRESQLLDERIANERCNARIHVTEEMCEYIWGRYGSKRDLVFYNYISESMIPASFKEKLSKGDGQVHIVYEGTLASYEGDHYDLRKIFKDIADHRMHIHIYVDSNPNKDYRKLAEKDGFIHYHGHLDPRRLFEEITRYDYGWSGFNVAKNKPHMDVALPNKLFEYLACGLPVLSFPHKVQKGFIEKHGVGLVFKDMEELREKLADKELLERIRENVSRKRLQFTVERNIGKIIRLYQTLA